ncbi:MAG: PhoU domain-containing protein [Candidatus Thermoplasmatota archaeon]
MEIRRVQMTGGSSYIITLPKEWVKKSNIQKNDPIRMLPQSDGSLLITVKMEKKDISKNKEFKIGKKPEENFLLRRLIGAYIAGFDSIKIKSKNRIPPAVRKVVRKFIQSTIGQEVVEETDNSITLKDLLNPVEMPFNRSVKRMHIMVKNMYEDTMTAFQDKNKTLAKDVIVRDNEVDRLHWLIARQHNILTRNVNFAEKMGTTIEGATTSFLISKRLERIGDHVIKISENIQNVMDENINPKIVNRLTKASDLSIKMLNKSIGAYSKKDIREANENIDMVDELDEICEEVKTSALKKEPLVALSIGYIAESIGRIGEYAEDISETVINHLVGKDK